LIVLIVNIYIYIILNFQLIFQFPTWNSNIACFLKKDNKATGIREADMTEIEGFSNGVSREDADEE